MITNTSSGTNVHEVADGIFRINTAVPVPGLPGGFSFNQYLIKDDAPLLFHSGPKQLFPLVHEAVGRLIAVDSLRYVGFSHFEADECGSLNQWLTAAPQSQPVCGAIAAMTSIGDIAIRPARVLQDGEDLTLGRHSVRWFDAPHTPHGWDCGFLMATTARTLLCGDLFTQPGDGATPVTESDIFTPSEAFRMTMDYFAHGPNTTPTLERLAAQAPTTLACMHGSAWRGDGAALLRHLAVALES